MEERLFIHEYMIDIFQHYPRVQIDIYINMYIYININSYIYIYIHICIFTYIDIPGIPRASVYTHHHI